jgi:uncharacterized membrane protein (DUF441 family)
MKNDPSIMGFSVNPDIASVLTSATFSISFIMPAVALVKKFLMIDPGIIPPRIYSLTIGVIRPANTPGFIFEKISDTLMKFEMVTSIMHVAIFSLLAGTIPYHPNSPKGYPGHTFSGIPVQAIG